MEQNKPEWTAPCPECGSIFPESKLFLVRDRKMCEWCGAKEIAKWNDLVSAPPYTFSADD